MFTLLLKSIREYKKPTLLSPIFVSMEVVVECIIPFITANFIDEIEKEGTIDLSRVFFYGAILIFMACVSLAFGVLAGAACAKASSGFAKNLRHDLYYKVQEFSFSNIDKHLMKTETAQYIIKGEKIAGESILEN